MNWYLKNILIAGGVEEYLQSLGATPDIIQFITSQGANSQILVNEFRQNPSLTIEQLQELVPAQQEQIDPYLPSERRLAQNFQLEMPQFSKWILVSLKKLRNSQRPPAGDLRTNENNPNFPGYFQLKEKISEIKDWVVRENPDISSYSPEQAIQASDEWHRTMAGKGEGKVYEQTKPELIIYGPEWKNPKWQGWTIQKVAGENDLLAEGNKMDHCVGDYCEKVESESSAIFSLRDPQNSPHVTMEFGGNKGYNPGIIDQIQGKGNSDPKPEYKEMIREWISNKGEESGIVTEINAFEKLEEDWSYDTPDVKNIMETIEKILMKDSDEYGLDYIFDSDMDTVIDKLITSAEAEKNWRSNHEYSGDITDAPPYVTNLALMADLRLPNLPRYSGEWDVVKSMPKKTGWNNIQEVERWAWEAIDEIQEDFYEQDTGLTYPHEEDYENPEEYEAAMEEFQEAESEVHDEWMRSTLKGGFAQDLIDELNDLRERGIIPSAQELLNRKQKAQEAKIKNSPAYENMRDRVEQHQASNNWYKKAQELEITDSENIKGKKRHYTGTGHDINYEEQNKILGFDPNKNYFTNDPNILWIYNNGQIETRIETEMEQTHRSKGNWGLSSHLDKLYTGRYSPSEKIISIIPPHEGMNKFREIPSFIQRALKQKFPEAKQMIRY